MIWAKCGLLRLLVNRNELLKEIFKHSLEVSFFPFSPTCVYTCINVMNIYRQKGTPFVNLIENSSVKGDFCLLLVLSRLYLLDSNPNVECQPCIRRACESERGSWCIHMSPIRICLYKRGKLSKNLQFEWMFAFRFRKIVFIFAFRAKMFSCH